MHPNPVYRDARREWVRRIGQPVCEVKAIGQAIRVVWSDWMQHRERARFYLGAFVQKIAANMDVRWTAEMTFGKRLSLHLTFHVG